MFSTELEEKEDAALLALATERMKNFDPARLISQDEVNAEFGFNSDLAKREEI